MKTIGQLKGLSTLPVDLENFIKISSPWMKEHWNPDELGYIFILDDSDIGSIDSVCIVPKAPLYEPEYRAQLSFNLATIGNEFEYATYDPISNFYHGVIVYGSVYGASFFFSEKFTENLPALKLALQHAMT